MGPMGLGQNSETYFPVCLAFQGVFFSFFFWLGSSGVSFASFFFCSSAESFSTLFIVSWICFISFGTSFLSSGCSERILPRTAFGFALPLKSAAFFRTCFSMMDFIVENSRAHLIKRYQLPYLSQP